MIGREYKNVLFVEEKLVSILRKYKWTTRIVVSIAVLTVMGLGRYGLRIQRDTARKASGPGEVRLIYLRMHEYAQDHKGMLPPLDPEPGRLMFERYVMKAEYGVTGATVTAEFDPEDPRDKLTPDEQTKFERNPEYIDDHSYWYLGFAVLNEIEARQFVECYREHVKTGASFEKEFLCSPYLLPRLKLSDELMAPRWWERRVADPVAGKIPCLIERPGNYLPTYSGGFVGYLDGYVEYIDYPGKFPMTEGFIGALEELDRLAPPVAGASPVP